MIGICIKKIVAEYKSHKNPNNPLAVNSAKAFYQQNYEPNFSCPFERRIGNLGDGGKWICDPHRTKHMATKYNDCLIYSIGSQGDFSFEVALQKYLNNGSLCEVHIFDWGNYESKMPKGLNLHYHKWGLKGTNDTISGDEGQSFEPRQYYTLAEIVKQLGHERRRAIDIFKIDCEGCEWDTVQDWMGPSIPIIHQIQVEVHKMPHQKILPFFDGLLNNGYVIFHKEANIEFSDNCIEFSFLKLDKAFFTNHS